MMRFAPPSANPRGRWLFERQGRNYLHPVIRDFRLLAVIVWEVVATREEVTTAEIFERARADFGEATERRLYRAIDRALATKKLERTGLGTYRRTV